MRSKLSAIAVLLIVGLSLARPAAAQEVTGTIAGTVTDSSGAVVPNASVTVTNMEKNVVIRSLVSGSSGEYVAALLPIGHYSVAISAPGFKAFNKTDIELNVNDHITVNARLVAGNVNEVVNVEAEALQVDTQSSAATGLITGTQVRELALKSRNYEELVALMPGVTTDVGDNLYVGVSAPSGGTNEVAFSLNGSLGSENNWTIDGADNVDRGGNFTLLNYPSVDAISEFKVLRGDYNAEFGRGAGGQINVITRSGVSKYHGTVYEFFRNDALNANLWVNKHVADPAGVLPTPALRYNDFGYTFGGPVFIPGHYNTEKNKTFFFFSQEFRRVHQPYTPGEAIVPNANERNGIFADPVCTAVDNAGNCIAQTTGPITPTPAAAAYIQDVFSHVPLPQDPVNHLLTATGTNTFNYRQEIVRIDHYFSPRFS